MLDTLKTWLTLISLKPNNFLNNKNIIKKEKIRPVKKRSITQPKAGHYYYVYKFIAVTDCIRVIHISITIQ